MFYSLNGILLIINDGEDLIKKVNVLVLDKSDLKNSQNQNHSELVNKDVVDHIQIDFFTLIQVEHPKTFDNTKSLLCR